MVNFTGVGLADWLPAFFSVKFTIFLYCTVYTMRDKIIINPGVINCNVLVKKCPGAYSTQWRYIVHVINSNQGHALYSVKSLLESMEVGQSVIPDSQILYTDSTNP